MSSKNITAGHRGWQGAGKDQAHGTFVNVIDAEGLLQQYYSINRWGLPARAGGQVVALNVLVILVYFGLPLYLN